MKKEVINVDELENTLSILANKIRNITGENKQLSFPDDFITSIEATNVVTQQELDIYLAAMANKTISALDNDKITRIPGGRFQKGNTNLTTVNLPNVTSLTESCFSNCKNITTLKLPKVATISGGSLAMLQKITQLYLPSLTTNNGWGWTFQNMSKCTRIYFPKLANSIQGYDFDSCSVLNTLILGHSAVCPLVAISAFNNTPIKNGTGYVYVPKDLVDAYKTAENWSTFANQIRAIEDYPEVLEGWE